MFLSQCWKLCCFYSCQSSEVKEDYGLGLRSFPRHKYSTIWLCTFQELWRFGGRKLILFIRTKTCNKELHYSVNECISLKYKALGFSLKKIILYDSSFFFLMFFSLFFYAAVGAKQWSLCNTALRFGWNSCAEITPLLQIRIQWKCGIAFEKPTFYYFISHIPENQSGISKCYNWKCRFF